MPFNNVTPEQADQLYAKIAELTGDPRNLTQGQLVEVLEFAKGIGLGDRYNSDTGYIQKNMVSARSADTRGSVESSYGSMNRNRDLVSAVFVKDGFVFEGEQGAQQRMPNGGVVVRVGDKIHAVQPDVFRTTYTLPDGQPVTSEFLASLQSPGQSSGKREVISFKYGKITYEAEVLEHRSDGSTVIRIGGSIHRLIQLPDAVQGAAVDAPSQATGKLTAAFTQLRTTGRGATEFRAAVEAYLTEELGRRPTEAEIVSHLTEKGEKSRLEVIRGLTGATEVEFAEVVEKAREGGALPKSTEAEARERVAEQETERTRRGK